MHPVWNRCLQGISLTVSCSSNSSKHTGHFSALSVKRKKRAWGKLKKNDSHGHQGSNSIKLAAMPNTIWIITNYPVANVPCMNVFADDFEWAVCHLLVLGRWWPQEDSEPRLWLQEAGDAGPNPTNQMNRSLCQDPASETYSRMIVKNG